MKPFRAKDTLLCAVFLLVVGILAAGTKANQVAMTDHPLPGRHDSVWLQPEDRQAAQYIPGQREAPPTYSPAVRPKDTPVTHAALKGTLNILLAGVDERESWSEGPPRTDAMMLASLDLDRRTAAVLSIPRDLWVAIPEFGQERINVAYRLGELERRGSGPLLACETVGKLLQVQVDKYVIVNFRAVRQIIDAMGGLEIDVPHDIWDYQYPTEDKGYTTIHFAAGKQVLNGERVLQYVRTRHGASDFERIRRQQQVLKALRARVTRPDFLPRIPGLLMLASDCISTNLSLSEIYSLYTTFKDAPDDSLTFAAIDEASSYPWTTTIGAEVLLPNQQAIEELVRDLGIRQQAPAYHVAQGLQIRIYASRSQDPGFAAATQLLLESGFDVWEGGVRENPCGHTVILDYSNGEYGTDIAGTIGLSDINVLNVPRTPDVPPQVVADILLWSSEDLAP